MRRFVLAVSALGLAACASTPQPTAEEQADICDLFEDRKTWFRAADKSEDRWGAPIPVQMAIIKTESNFDADARPPKGRRRLLGVLPGKRPSSARGFAQALDGTWDEYKRATGNSGADRDSFKDSTDFVGWYVNRTSRITGVSRGDARSQYLAYHEGPGGFQSGSWRSDPALIRIADRVAADAARYERQLPACRKTLERRGFLFF